MHAVHQPIDPPRAAAGSHKGPNPIRKRQHPDLVAPNQGDMGQEQHRVERMVERRKPVAGIAGHQPSAIDQEDDPLALVVLKGPGCQLAPPGRRSPVDVARIVAFDVVAQPLKLVVRAQPARPPHPIVEAGLAAPAS